MHSYFWYNHMGPNAGTPEWLPYIGAIGDFWTNGVAKTPSTVSPARHYSWWAFEEDYSEHGFGNTSEHPFYIISKSITWVQEPNVGD